MPWEDPAYETDSFQKQAKRQMHRCQDCYTYSPHCHKDRLERIPSAPTIFDCGNADISFCPPEFTRRNIQRITEHNVHAPQKTYYIQSKQPEPTEEKVQRLATRLLDAGIEVRGKTLRGVVLPESRA